MMVRQNTIVMAGLIAIIFLFCDGNFSAFGAAERVEDAKASSSKETVETVESIYRDYVNCLERVYHTMEENYYRPVTTDAYNRFLEKFDKDIYGKVEEKDKRSNFVCWRSAAYLVDYLKDPEDTFSAFYPPKAADTYAKEALGQKVDLGIEGKLTKEGFVVTHVEPRADAHQKGLKVKDIVLSIDGVDVLGLSEEAIKERLTPFIDTSVRLFYFDHLEKIKKTIQVISMEYFKQTVFQVPVDVPGIFCLQIQHFNKETASDLLRYLMVIEKYGNSGLILDLRGNPGGPPLAAREMSAFFLPANQELAYFQKKGQPKAFLSIPAIPDKYQYRGPLAILVDKGSGSSSELFSGTLQKRGRAVLVGQNTAGKVMLKSMFDYDDGSMLLLVTARGHSYDGSVFPFSGLVPDLAVADDKVDLIYFTANYLKKKMLAETLSKKSQP